MKDFIKLAAAAIFIKKAKDSNGLNTRRVLSSLLSSPSKEGPYSPPNTTDINPTSRDSLVRLFQGGIDPRVFNYNTGRRIPSSQQLLNIESLRRSINDRINYGNLPAIGTSAADSLAWRDPMLFARMNELGSDRVHAVNTPRNLLGSYYDTFKDFVNLGTGQSRLPTNLASLIESFGEVGAIKDMYNRFNSVLFPRIVDKKSNLLDTLMHRLWNRDIVLNHELREEAETNPNNNFLGNRRTYDIPHANVSLPVTDMYYINSVPDRVRRAAMAGLGSARLSSEEDRNPEAYEFLRHPSSINIDRLLSNPTIEDLNMIHNWITSLTGTPRRR